MRKVETPPREIEREVEAVPPEGWHKPEALPQKGESEIDVPLQGSPNEGRT